MKLDEAKTAFIESWGTLGSQWGINRTMAQMHALLLISPNPMSTEEIMSQLNISRGNANMNIRSLMDWGLASKINRLGERKDYFQADKDIWSVAMKVVRQRRTKELQPVLNILKEVSQVEDKTANPAELKEFKKTIKDLNKFSGKADKVLQSALRAEENWLSSILLKAVK